MVVTAPKTAWRRFQQTCSRLSREKIKNSARLGRPIKDIMLNEKTHSNQPLRGARIDKGYYVKDGSARIRYIITQKKSSKIKDLGKSFKIKDLANSLILNEKFFPLKSIAYAARMRQSAKATQVQKLRALAPAASSEKSTVGEKIFFNLFGYCAKLQQSVKPMSSKKFSRGQSKTKNRWRPVVAQHRLRR